MILYMEDIVMARKGFLNKFKDMLQGFRHAPQTVAEEEQEQKLILPAYVRVQSGEITYEEAVLELADGLCWILDTAYEAAYPGTYIKGILTTFVSPAKELAFASTFLVMTNNPAVAFMEALGREISLYDLALEAEAIAGKPLLKDAAWREPFYRFAAELAQEGCLAQRTYETEAEYDSLFRHIGECLQMYAAKHPVDQDGIPLDYVRKTDDVSLEACKEAGTAEREHLDRNGGPVGPAPQDAGQQDVFLGVSLDEVIDESPLEEENDDDWF